MKDIWLEAVRAAMNGAEASSMQSEANALSPMAMLAMARLLHRAAAPLSLSEHKPVPSPLPVCRPVCPEAVVSILAAIGRHQDFQALLSEFLALLVRRRWRLPPERLPEVLEAALQQKIPAPALFRALGPSAVWLAWQHPRWRIGFWPSTKTKRKNKLPLPASVFGLKVHWPDLPHAVWERFVLDLAHTEQAWASADGALTAALTQSLHPWPDRILPLWRAHIERERVKQPYQASPHGLALLRAAALRASPERLLEALGDATEWPHAWRDIWSRARDVASLRLRMHQTFRQV